MQNKKNINFKQEIENSEKFLQKLQTIKKTSKEIKEKNKLTQHKNLWVKEFKYLSRLQRDMDSQINDYLQSFDRYFEYDFQERQIFATNNYKNYSQLRQHIAENFLIFEAQTLKQVQSLPLLAEKCNKINFKDLNKSQILQILRDISKVLDSVERENAELELQLNKHSDIQNKIQEEDYQEFEEDFHNFSALKQISSSIKGFDMEKEKIKKLKESEKNLIHYLDCFNDKLTEDQIYEVINEFNHASGLLEETYLLQQQKISLDYEDALKIDSSMLESSLNFNKINHIYSTYIGRGKSVQLYFERLSIQFPKMNRKTFEMMTSYIEAKIYKEKKLKAIKRNYYREKEDLFAKVDKQIHLRIEKKIQRAKKKAEELERREQKLKLDKELEILRVEYDRRNQQKQKLKREQQFVQKQTQKRKEALRKLYLDELTKKAEEIQEVKTQKQIMERKNAQIKKQQEEIDKKFKITLNKPKVQLRQSIQRKKIEKKIEDREIKAKIPEIQAERIKNAIQNYNFRPKVEFSQERLNKPTQALIKKRQTLMDKSDKVQLSKITGYSVNQLMKDMRFKLNTALQEAGLSNTDYARQILVSMSKQPS